MLFLLFTASVLSRKPGPTLVPGIFSTVLNNYEDLFLVILFSKLYLVCHIISLNSSAIIEILSLILLSAFSFKYKVKVIPFHQMISCYNRLANEHLLCLVKILYFIILMDEHDFLMNIMKVIK